MFREVSVIEVPSVHHVRMPGALMLIARSKSKSRLTGERVV